MTAHAPIQRRAAGLREANLLHFLAADRTLAPTYGCCTFAAERQQLPLAGSGIAQDQREFTMIQPNTAAGDAIVDLQLIVLARDQWLAARNTFHSRGYYTVINTGRYINLVAAALRGTGEVLNDN